MDFFGRLNLEIRPTPFCAIFEADILTLIKSKIMLAWVIISFFFGCLIVISNPLASAMDRIQTNMWMFIYIWSLIIIGISASSISSESGVIADSLLSRSVKRYEYILAKVCSRCTAVLVVYLTVIFVLSLIAVRIAPVDDLDTWGWLRSVLMVALILIFLTILGVTVSTISSSTMVSVILVLLAWYILLVAAPSAQMDMLSPGYLIDHASRIMTGYWDTTLWQMAGSFSGISTLLILIAVFYFEGKDLVSE